MKNSGSTEIPVTEIAFKSGFNNSNYFTRLFTKHLGCNTREYRKKIICNF